MRALPFPHRVKVRGVSFYQPTVTNLLEGQPLQLSADPTNMFDPNAVEVRTATGELCGYLPAAVAARFAASGDNCWNANVAEVYRGFDNVGVLIEVTGPTAPAPSESERPSSGPTAAPVPQPLQVGGPATLATGRTVGRVAEIGDGYVVVDSEAGRLRFPSTLLLAA